MAENEDDVGLPRFFKAFSSATDSEFMEIPMSFNEYLQNPLPETAMLQGIGGGVWSVRLFINVRDRAYFLTGWSKFVEDHELKDGEYMTFVYDGYHTFEVSVFGRDGCKEIRAVVETLEISDADSEEKKEEEEEDPSVDAVSDDEEAEDDPSFDADEEVSQSINPVDSEETESDAAVVAGFSNMDIRENPWFITKRKNKRSELTIPAYVIRDHGLTFENTIKYIDEEGVLTGDRAKYYRDRVCFKGWDRICRRNRLREQDEVHCEVLHTRKKVHSIKITITRG